MKPLQIDEFKTSENRYGLHVFSLLALTPIAAVLIPWDFGPLENKYRQLIAGHSLAIILIELFIFIAFFKNESLISDFAKKLNRNDKIVAAAFALAMAFSFLFVSDVKLLAIFGFLALLVHCFFTLSLFKNMNYVEKRSQEVFWILLGVSVIIYVALWAVDFVIYPPVASDWIDRVPGVTNVRWAGFFWLSIFAAGFVFVKASGVRHFLLAVFFGAFGLTMTLWTGTRGSFLAIIFGVICTLILAPTYRKFIFKYCFMSIVVAISINVYLPVPHKQYGIDRVFSLMQPDAVIEGGGSGRVELWTSTIKLIQEQPFVGHGMDQFQKMGPEQTLGFKGPHSFPLQLLFSAGIIGLLTLLYSLWRFLTAYRLDLRSPHQLAAGVFLSGGCLYSVYDNFLYYPYSVAILTVSAFMLFRSRAQGISRSSRAVRSS